ncbi:MAG: DUF6318 family protein [Kineosporiaceae bacterium]
MIAVTGEITRERSGRRVRVVAAAAGVVVLIGAGASLALRGNGSGGSDPSPQPTPGGTTSSASPAATVSASPSATRRPPRLPDEASEPTRGGAAAFVRHFFAVYNYSFATLDTSAIERISADGCKFCDGVVRDVRSAREQGLRFEGARVSVNAAVAAPGKAREGLVVNGSIDQSAGRSVDRSGATRRELPAAKNVRVDAGVRWTAQGWIVFAVALPGS